MSSLLVVWMAGGHLFARPPSATIIDELDLGRAADYDHSGSEASNMEDRTIRTAFVLTATMPRIL
jgi:hypothetical protein